MKKLTKLLFLIIILHILLGLYNTNSYAENTTVNTNITQKSTTNKTATQTNINSRETTKKSSNANLSNLGIKPNDFSGFKTTTTSYNATVPENVEEIEVYATVQDSKATVSGIGKKQLEKGKNTVSVIVTAEDGTKKTYTINVTRGGATDEETEEPTEAESRGLSELKIGDLNLTPEFRTDIYEYTVKYIGEDTKLDISTVATDMDYIVEVTGNEELKEGENIITILVSDAEGNNVATYQVIVNKSLVDEEVMKREQEEKEQQKKKIIIGSIIAVVILIIIIILVIRHRRNKYYDEDEEWESEEDHNDLFAETYIQDKENLIEDDTPNDKEDTAIDNEEKIENKEQDELTDIENEQTDDKEVLRRRFLENYNSNNYDEYDKLEEDKPKRRKHKGKRFK